MSFWAARATASALGISCAFAILSLGCTSCVRTSRSSRNPPRRTTLVSPVASKAAAPAAATVTTPARAASEVPMTMQVPEDINVPASLGHHVNLDKLRIIGPQALVRRLRPEERSASGLIIIPESARGTPSSASSSRWATSASILSQPSRRRTSSPARATTVRSTSSLDSTCWCASSTGTTCRSTETPRTSW